MMKKAVFGLAAVIAAVTVVLAGCATSGVSWTEQQAEAAGFVYETRNGRVTITDYTGSVKDVVIPNRINNKPVTAIGDGAFASGQVFDKPIPLTSVTIPDGVTVIGDYAFAWNQLTSITIPDGVTTIGDRAFLDNPLTSVTIPDSVTAIGDGAFDDNPLTSVTIGANVDIQVSSFYALLYAHYAAGGRKAAVYTFERSASGDFETVISDNTVEIAGYTGSAKDVTIPAWIDNQPIIAIGDGAFARNWLTSILIPDTVTAIGDGALANNRLSSVIIPDGVTAIGNLAFQGNQLTSVLIPDSVTAIGEQAFANNRLTSVTIPDSVTAIGARAFYNNQLTSVTIPANVDIQPSSFYRLLYAHYAAGGRKAAVYTFERSASGDFETVVFNNAVEIIDYTGSAKDIDIPGETGGLPVTTIGDGAFAYNQLTSVTIPDGVTVIGGRAFQGNQLTSVLIPDGVTTIGEEAFANNYRLTSILIPDGVTAIGYRAFASNSLNSVTIPDSVTVIGEGAFWKNPLTIVTIGANVDAGEDAFPGDLADVYARNRSRAGTYTSGDRGKTWSNTGNALTRGEAKAAGFGYRTENGTVTITGYTGSVKDVVIPNRINNKLVTAIGDGAFANNRLSSVFIPNGVTVIGNSAFRDNQLTHLAIGNGVTAIGDGAFASNSLTSVSIPNSVTAIGVEAFADNRLTSVLIPNGVAVIGVRAFRTNQLTHLAIGSGVTAIGDLAFAANRLTRVTIPSGVTTIGNDAFLYNQLDSVTIPANVDIQPSSFYRLLYAHYAAAGRKAAVYTFERSASGDFETVTSNNTVEITGYTGSAKDVTIPARIDNQPVIAIGEGAFYNSQLTSVLIPDGVTAIGFGAFEGNRLTSVTIGANVEISRFASFPGDLEDVYTDKGKLAGTYTSGDGGKTWTRQ